MRIHDPRLQCDFFFLVYSSWMWRESNLLTLRIFTWFSPWWMRDISSTIKCYSTHIPRYGCSLKCKCIDTIKAECDLAQVNNIDFIAFCTILYSLCMNMNSERVQNNGELKPHSIKVGWWSKHISQWEIRLLNFLSSLAY